MNQYLVRMLFGQSRARVFPLRDRQLQDAWYFPEDGGGVAVVNNSRSDALKIAQDMINRRPNNGTRTG